MKLAFSTNSYLNHPFEEAAARISRLGYEGLELLADVPHAWPAGLLEDQKHQIKAVMERSGLEFSNINAFMMNAIADHRQPYWHPSFIEPDPHYRQVRIDHTRRACRFVPSSGRHTLRQSQADHYFRVSFGSKQLTCSSRYSSLSPSTLTTAACYF